MAATKCTWHLAEVLEVDGEEMGAKQGKVPKWDNTTAGTAEWLLWQSEAKMWQLAPIWSGLGLQIYGKKGFG